MRLPPATAAHALVPGSVTHPDEPGRQEAWPEPSAAAITPQALPSPADPPFVLARGAVEATFPSLSVEKEFYQAIDPNAEGRALFASDDTLDLWRANRAARDGNLVYTVLSKPENLYIAREMCWTLRVAGGAGGYRLLPEEDGMVNLLIAALAPGNDGKRLAQCLVGQRIEAAPPSPCDAEGFPPLHPLRLEPLTVDGLVKRLAKLAPTADVDRLKTLVSEGMTLAANPGDTAERRALNFLALEDPGFYLHDYRQRYDGKSPDPDGFELVAVEPRIAATDGLRRVVQLRLDYQGRDTGVIRRWTLPVDVTGAYPFALADIQRSIGGV